MSDPGLRARQPKAIQNAFAVLEAVAATGPGTTAQQVSEALGMPRATTYRLITLLVEDEYLVRLSDLRGFALGHKVAELAGLGAAPSLPPLSRAVRSVLAEVRSSVRAGVHLARYDDASGLADVDVDPDFPLLDERGLRADPGASAMGRLHAHGGTEVVRQVGAFRSGFGCLAVPVLDEHGLLVAGLTLSAAAPRIDSPGDLLPLLQRGADRLEPLLA